MVSHHLTSFLVENASFSVLPVKEKNLTQEARKFFVVSMCIPKAPIRPYPHQ